MMCAQVHVASAGDVLACAAPPSHQQASAESTKNNQGLPSAKSTSLKNDLLMPGCLSSKKNPILQPLSAAGEILDEFKIGWHSRGIPNMEENTSEESDALWEAYRELGSMEDHEATQEQCESPKNSEKDKHLPMDKENTLKLLRDESEDEEVDLEQRTLKVWYRGCGTHECFVKLELYRNNLHNPQKSLPLVRKTV